MKNRVIRELLSIRSKEKSRREAYFGYDGLQCDLILEITFKNRRKVRTYFGKGYKGTPKIICSSSVPHL
mgnify:CR=1 FL=1